MLVSSLVLDPLLTSTHANDGCVQLNAWGDTPPHVGAKSSDDCEGFYLDGGAVRAKFD
jgi:hypothetical protein